ncbi:hypothetical protein PF010_g3783 [Phytophthora fragariae]|uniref:Crinkler effector protein N-terminal domain-containing protein n=1 Tax=Phytophthora fragariae TaxID=53985 RepID=A0A6G0RHB8_9STRA|nr:hypothetical protein PF003_g4898 [Phytophthora fragariae]KAE9130609.1 hypothetical protein PF010_g3783 [Phytophthora fragariae]KAE9333659.1 hypothetical protein PF008_g14342 [Phytophthora fragariae]
MKLVCSIVGMPRGLFEVEIDKAASVYALKESVIKKTSMEDIKAFDLQLFLAKRNSGAWLDAAGAAAVVFDGDGRPQIIDADGRRQGFGDEMNPTMWLKNDRCFGENFERDEGQVHVLVVVRKYVRANVGKTGSRASAYTRTYSHFYLFDATCC